MTLMLVHEYATSIEHFSPETSKTRGHQFNLFPDNFKSVEVTPLRCCVSSFLCDSRPEKTIHRCQGDTLDRVVVDFTTTRKEAHTHYVGMSRVKSLDGLFILNLCADKISVNESVREEMSHLRTDRCMSLALYLSYYWEKT